MRLIRPIIMLSFLATYLGCGDSATMNSQTSRATTDAPEAPAAATAPASQSPGDLVETEAAAAPASNPAANSPASPSTAATPAKAVPTQAEVMTVASTVVNSSNLPAARKTQMNSSIQAVIQAAQTKDQGQIQATSGQLIGVALGQAYSGGAVPGFGLVDPAALRKAIEDLVAAAIDADLDGIKKAVEDIVAASV